MMWQSIASSTDVPAHGPIVTNRTVASSASSVSVAGSIVFSRPSPGQSATAPMSVINATTATAIHTLRAARGLAAGSWNVKPPWSS